MNILVVRNDKLGDFITALPAIYVLKKHKPENKIVVLIAPLNKALANACDFIDEVIVDSNQSIWSLSREIRSQNIDASVTLFSNTRVALAQFLAGISTRIAPATKIAQIFYNKRVKQRRSQVKMAEFEYNLELTRALFPNISLEYKKPLLQFKDSDKIFNSFVKDHSIEKEIIVFHVGSGGSSDANWNLNEYILLISTLLNEDKYQLMLTFGPDEKELYEEMQEMFQGSSAIFYLSTDGLVYFARLLSGVKLFISTSTGTYHVASAVGTPTMTFFADSLFASAKRWKSVGDIEKQTHISIPHNAENRKIVLEEVKEILLAL